MSDEPIDSKPANNSDNSISDNIPAKQDIGKAEPETDKTKNEPEENKEEVKQVLSIVREPENKEAKTANRISGAGVIINIVLIIITLAALWQTKKSVDISADSLKYAKDKDISDNILQKEKDRIADSISNALAVKNKNREIYLDSINRSKDSINNRLAEKSLGISQQNADAAKASVNAQINTLKTSQEQFKNINQPFIVIGDCFIQPFMIGGGLFVDFSFANLTDIPIKIYSQRTVTFVNSFPLSLYGMRDSAVGMPTNTSYYAVKEEKYETIIGCNTYITPDIYNRLVTKNYSVYVFKQIKYKDLVSPRNRICDVYLKLTWIPSPTKFPNNTYIDVLYYENYNEGETPPKE